MIQRIQSVYLLVVSILAIVCMCCPVGSIIASTREISEFSNLCILLVIAVVALGTIFLFKNRMLQIRLTIFSSVLLIGYYITLVAFILMLADGASFTPSWTICLPVVSIVLNWLAIRSIGADEALVKAYDRLR